MTILHYKMFTFEKKMVKDCIYTHTQTYTVKIYHFLGSDRITFVTEGLFPLAWQIPTDLCENSTLTLSWFPSFSASRDFKVDSDYIEIKMD